MLASLDFVNSGTSREFSAPKMKHRTLQEMARMVLNSKKLPVKLWTEAINIAFYILNHLSPQSGRIFGKV